MHRKLMILCATSTIAIFGCASSPEEIQAQHVSTAQYQSYDCGQIEAELKRVSSKVQEVTGQQQEEANQDAVAMGVGLVLFWPALFFLADDDKEERLSRLKGEYEALERVAIKKDCTVADKLEKMREKQQEQENARKEEDESDSSIHSAGPSGKH